MTLAELGWDEKFAAAFAEHAAAGFSPARVTLELKGYYEITDEAGARLAECSGRFGHGIVKASDLPVIGDWVAVSPQPGDIHRAAIQAVLPRRTKLSRTAAGEDAVEQVVAANLDVVLVVNSLDENFNLARIERYLAAVWSGGAQPVVVLNKADLTEDSATACAQVHAIAPDVPVFATSAQTRRGLKALAPFLLPGRTVAVVGSSGVGKSTLINRLVGEERQFTQEVREADSKGRHTTTQRELIVTSGGVIVIDTPGMRALQPWRASGVVAAAYAEVAEVAARCRFRDCTHTVEPGCAVIAALADGTLDLVRWQSYLRLQKATAHEVRQVDRRAGQAQKASTRRATKELRRRIREKQGEE